MTHAVEIARAAVRQLRKLVGGAGEWRVRTGDFRIVYEIHDGRLLVLVVAVGHRRDVDDRRP